MNKTTNDVLSAIFFFKTLRNWKIICNWIGREQGHKGLVSDRRGAVTGLGDDEQGFVNWPLLLVF